MKRGVVSIEFAAGAEVAAPSTGLQLGAGQSGPVTLRLFRPSGTRVTLAGRVLPAQLLALRAAGAGTSVQVVTVRPQLWEPLLRDASSAHVVSDPAALVPAGGPGLLVDDRPSQGRAPLELRAWQCRVDVRTQWIVGDLGSFVRSDLVVFAAVPGEAARAVTAAFALPRAAGEQLGRLDSNSFALVSRGRVEYVSLDPTSAEGQVLERARGVGSLTPPRR